MSEEYKLKGLRVNFLESTNHEKTLTLGDVVGKETKLKEWLVDYVGEKYDSEGDVTVSMVVDTLADEFPEFLLAVAEENWIRGYQQGLLDVEVGEKIAPAVENDQ